MNVIKKVGANFVSTIGYFILLVGIKSTISVIHSLVLDFGGKGLRFFNIARLA